MRPRSLSFLLLFYAAVARAELVVRAEHTAWDIRFVNSLFEKDPGATKIIFWRDSGAKPGKYQVIHGSLPFREMAIPAWTSSNPEPFLVDYPKTYARDELKDLLQALRSGDKADLGYPHETAALLKENGRRILVVERTGTEDAKKLAVDRLIKVDLARKPAAQEPVRFRGRDYLKRGLTLLHEGQSAPARGYLQRATEFAESCDDAARELGRLAALAGEAEPQVSCNRAR